MIRRLTRLLGVERAPEATLGVRFRWWSYVLAAVVLAVLLGFQLVRYSESPTFCNSCHIMNPYYQAWKASAHSDVPCVDCHYPPGSHRTILWKKFQAVNQVVAYVTKTYSSRPFAEVSDGSCLRSGCHATSLLEGTVRSERGIKFDHRPHLSDSLGRKLRCVSCHSQITVGHHIEISYESCFLCHFKGRTGGREMEPLGGCLGCHDLPARTFQIGDMRYNHQDFVTRRGLPCQNCHLDVVSGTGDVSAERCLSCHNQPEALAHQGEAALLHQKHVAEKNMACFHCHDEIRHGEATAPSPAAATLPHPSQSESSAEKAPAGAPVHPPALTFDCAFCHQDKHGGQLLMYSGRAEALGLPEMPSPMYKADVDCVGCHYRNGHRPGEEFRGYTYLASDQACVKCHGPTFEGIWEETRREFVTTLARMETKISAAEDVLERDGGPDGGGDALRSNLEHARRWYTFVRYSRGEHNPYLASLALRRANAALDEIGREAGAELPDLSDLPLISGRYCASLCHARVGVKVPPEEVTAEVFGSTMPHAMHAESMDCVRCHEIGKHKDVPLRPNVVKEVCSECH